MTKSKDKLEIASPMELIVLSLCNKICGKDIINIYQRETGYILTTGTLYITIRRLIRNKYVKKIAYTYDKRYKLYSITEKGKTVLYDSRRYYSELANFNM